MRPRCDDCEDRRATGRDGLCTWCRSDYRYNRWIRRMTRRAAPDGGLWGTAWDPEILGTPSAERNRRWRIKTRGRKP